jgi:hypothetical protein
MQDGGDRLVIALRVEATEVDRFIGQTRRAKVFAMGVTQCAFARWQDVQSGTLSTNTFRRVGLLGHDSGWP